MLSLRLFQKPRKNPGPLLSTQSFHDEESWRWYESFLEGGGADFEKIFERYKTPVINLAFRFLGNRQAAEDTAQEVFLKLYEKKLKLDPRAKFSTWLYRVTVNASLDLLRKGKSARTSTDLTEENTPLDQIPSPSPAHLQYLQEEELKKTVRAEIAKLPEKLKIVLLLFQFEELSYRETAAILGITEKAVEKRLYHAREHLRKRLESLIS